MQSLTAHLAAGCLLLFVHRHFNSKFRPALDTNTQQKSTFHYLYKEGGWDVLSHKTWRIQMKEHRSHKVFREEAQIPGGNNDLQQQYPSTCSGVLKRHWLQQLDNEILPADCEVSVTPLEGGLKENKKLLVLSSGNS